MIGEPRTGTPSTAMQLLKQRASRLIHKQESKRAAESQARPSHRSAAERNGSFWETRFYDFNVWSRKKKIEKLAYMHMNPVKRGLASRPDGWIWSSYSFYQGKGEGLIRIDLVE
ncbi:MAG: hypothetical protein WA737_12770 [Candidatus Acidiferrales bacterium]